MQSLLLKLLNRLYVWVKSSRYASRLYYAVANTQYFSSLQIQEGMLADRVRVDAYHQAILKYVRQGDHVVDLGTGTGILSFFAAAKQPARLYALEHGPVIELARAAAAENQIANIEFLAVNSKTFQAAGKIDVILHEQMGAFLFDERMVENVLDLRDRVLREGGRILPAKFEWYIEPVKLIETRNIPFAWEKPVHGITFRSFKPRSKGLGVQYFCRRINAHMVDHLLCDPEPVLRFDLETIEPDQLPRQIRYTRQVKHAGRLDGYCCYFRAIFDEEIFFATGPSSAQTSWSLPLFRVEAKDFAAGDTIEFSMECANIADPASYRW
jgi:protein arginine N-methyltransferase 1